MQYITQQGDIIMAPPVVAKSRRPLLRWLVLLGTAAILSGSSAALILIPDQHLPSDAAASVGTSETRGTVCWVTQDGVDVRKGPGSDYPLVDTVGEGQGFTPYASENSDETWYTGRLWGGGDTYVWIRKDYLDCQRTPLQTPEAQTVCHVTEDGVSVRKGPGSEYRLVTTIGEGEDFFYRYASWNSDETWYMGDLWGGDTYVWIRKDYLDCQ
ncbi:SH3 domain-containing protein [Streptomyces sp. 6N223]|uniref:SH3 domain-containing protein n=1 Tax=Streptomyces sp. 6N223 TaxID=3457412 RepID=UPI003FD08AD4